MDKEQEIVVFANYNSEIEANIIKGVLETNGVPAGVLTDQLANTLMHAMDPGSVSLLVRRADLQRAREILDAQPQDDESQEQ